MENKGYTIWFEDIDTDSIEIVGGKGANLGAMTRAGLPVPPGYCVTAQAYRCHLRELDINQAEFSFPMLVKEPEKLSEASNSIQTIICNNPMPDEIRSAILECYSTLMTREASKLDRTLRVAVRSSATAEDLPDASFAGQQDSYLNVIGSEHLIAQVKSCWASMWSPRAILYREEMGFDHNRVFAAVVVQMMVEAEVSGVMFTANPVNGNLNEAVVNASWGLGEAIVSGRVTPDTYTLCKERQTILDKEIGSKEIKIQYAFPAGIKTTPTNPRDSSIQALPDEHAIELLEMGTRIESHYGQPQDIEWAWANNQFFLLQTRPITTLGEGKQETEESPEYNRTMFIELFPDALSPIFSTVMHRLIWNMLDYTLRAWGFIPPAEKEGVRIFYHQPYFNRNYIESALISLPDLNRNQIVNQIMNPFSKQERSLQLSFSFSYLRMIYRTLRFMLRFPKKLAEILDCYREEVEAFKRADPKEMSDFEIARQVRKMVFGTSDRLLSIDFLMIVVIGVAYQILGTLLEWICGEDTEILRAKLISGVSGNVTMETNARLWDLSQVAKSSTAVSSIIRSTEGKELQAKLSSIAEGREFLIALDAFLKEYGHREIRLDIMYPTWGEDPTPVFGFIRAYLGMDTAQSPRDRQIRLEEEQKEAIALIRQRLEERGSLRYLITPIFSRFLKLAQVNTRERDTIHFELTRLFPTCRQYLLELGDRWTAADWMEQPEDIYYLHFEEMESMAGAPYDAKELIHNRRRVFTADQKRNWPDIIRGKEEYFIRERDSENGSEEIYNGVAGSPGLVEGEVRVITNPSEFDKLEEGDILVAPLTTPVWTPLFALASAVVTDTGGILSHGAIVAREYGIPAVMSVQGASQNLSDGQFIRVDGSRGVVTLLQKEAS